MLLWNMSLDSRDTGTPLQHTLRSGWGEGAAATDSDVARKKRWRIPSCLVWCDSSLLSGQVSSAAAGTGPDRNRSNFHPNMALYQNIHSDILNANIH